MEKDSLKNCAHMTCAYTKKINEAAQMRNKAMFRPRDVRKARQEMEGFEPVD